MAKEDYVNIGKVQSPVKHKDKVWEWALDQIQDVNIRHYVKARLVSLPDKFYMKPASSTGKYHPAISQGEGGLFRHIMLAFKIAIVRLECCNKFYNFTELDQDIIKASILLHDWKKYGKDCEEKNCPHEHPQIGADELPIPSEPRLAEVVMAIKSSVASHSGMFTTSNYSSVILPEPSNTLELFVHECDLLAGQKFYDLDELKVNEVEYFNTRVEILTEPQANYITKLCNNKKNNNSPISGESVRNLGLSKQDGIALITELKKGNVKFFIIGAPMNSEQYKEFNRLVKNIKDNSIVKACSMHDNGVAGLFVAYRDNIFYTNICKNLERISAERLLTFLRNHSH